MHVGIYKYKYNSKNNIYISKYFNNQIYKNNNKSVDTNFNTDK